MSHAWAGAAGVKNSQPSIDQDVRMRDFRFRVQNVWWWVKV
jgi:hypothetical protein